MNKVFLIFRNEIFRVISRSSFWVGVFGPLFVGLIISTGVTYLNPGGKDNGSQSTIKNVEAILSVQDDLRARGYVDPAGLVQAFPPKFPRDLWVKYADEASARSDLKDGKIGGFYVIPGDYLNTGSVQLFMEKYRLSTGGTRADEFESLIAYNLLNGNENLLNIVQEPIKNLDKVSLSPQRTKPKGDMGDIYSFMGLYGLSTLLMIAIMNTSGMLLNSLTKEKENRAMEILLVSANAREILVGKILGQGVTGLLMTTLWGLSGLVLQNLPGRGAVTADYSFLQPVTLFWAIIFFILGYMIYATLMTSLGMLVPHLREVSQITFLALLPLLAPLILISVFLQKPNGAIAVVLSLIPLSAPTAMVMRITMADVPLWQILLSVLLCVLTAVIVVSITAKLFQSQTLLSNQKSKLIAYFTKLFSN